MNVTARLRQHLKSNPELAKLLMPGTKNEVLLDLNGDGKVDFAFIDQTGDGMPETLAIDRTGNGELNLYFYDADGNGLADTVLSYRDGEDIPSYTKISKDNEMKLEEILGRLRGSMKTNDPEDIRRALYGVVDILNERAKVFGKEGNLARMRARMKEDPEMAKLLLPSPKNELFIDLNDDGVADLCLIDTNHSGNIDTMGIDLSGDGEFDLYLTDTDDNGVSDHVTYFKPGEEEPTVECTGSELEEALRAAAMKVIISNRSNFDAKTMVKAFKTFRKEAVAALKTVIK